MTYQQILRRMWTSSDLRLFESHIGRSLDFDDEADDAVAFWIAHVERIALDTARRPAVERLTEEAAWEQHQKLIAAEQELDAVRERSRQLEATRKQVRGPAIIPHGKKRLKPRIPYDIADHPNA